MDVAADPREDAGRGTCERCQALDVQRWWWKYTVVTTKVLVMRDRLCDTCYEREQGAWPDQNETPVLPPE